MAKLTNEQVQQLEKDPRVESVVQDVRYRAIDMASSSSSEAAVSAAQTVPWGVERVGGPLDGSGKKAWILDTGIDLNHNDLNVDQMNSVSYIANETAGDLNGHGTHVAGILAGSLDPTGVEGVAAGAQVVSVKVCNQNQVCYTSDVEAGVDYVASRYSSGDVANLSLSYPTNNPELPYIDTTLTVLENTIKTAADDGLMFTLSAGNSGNDANNYSPARIEHTNVWTVSGYDDNDQWYSESNYGNPPIEYGAPGVDVLSLDINGGTTTMSGTSMAAPHIAGLLLAAPQGIATDGTVSGDPDNDPDPIAVAAELTVYITGPGTVDAGQQDTWTAHPEHGSSGYSYQWYYNEDLSDPASPWVAAGTDSDTFNHTFTDPSDYAGVKVDVTSGGDQASDTHTVTVLNDPCDPMVELCDN